MRRLADGTQMGSISGWNSQRMEGNNENIPARHAGPVRCGAARPGRPRRGEESARRREGENQAHNWDQLGLPSTATLAVIKALFGLRGNKCLILSVSLNKTEHSSYSKQMVRVEQRKHGVPRERGRERERCGE